MTSHANSRINLTKTTISILIYNYKDDLLNPCLESIFSQQELQNIEIIICNNTGSDTAWDTANQYALRHPEKITISRNSIPLGKNENRQKGLRMCKGEFIIELTESMRFDAPYISRAIQNMIDDAAWRWRTISNI